MYNYNIVFDILLALGKRGGGGGECGAFGLVVTVLLMTVHTRHYVSNVFDT